MPSRGCRTHWKYEQVGMFDPASETFSRVGPSISGESKYVGGVLLPSGDVLFVPCNADSVAIFDPATYTVSLVGGDISGIYCGGVLLP